MSIARTIKSYLGLEESTTGIEEYRCTECDHVFESAKDPERALCEECLSHDVERVGE